LDGGAQCTQCAIESTGVSGKPVFNILEDALTVILIQFPNMREPCGAERMSKTPNGCDLLRHGLLKASFIPPPRIRELRELTRYRDSLVREQGAVANRIQKLIESGNINSVRWPAMPWGRAAERSCGRWLAEKRTRPNCGLGPWQT